MFANWRAKVAAIGGFIGGLLTWFAFFGIDAKTISGPNDGALRISDLCTGVHCAFRLWNLLVVEIVSGHY
jgi:hypothetical protein